MVSNILYKYCITAQNVSYLHENISIHSFIHEPFQFEDIGFWSFGKTDHCKCAMDMLQDQPYYHKYPM